MFELTEGIAALLVALIGLFGVIIQTRRLRRENTEQHAEGRLLLAAVGAKVDLVHDDVKDVRHHVMENRVDIVRNRERIAAIEPMVLTDDR